MESQLQAREAELQRDRMLNELRMNEIVAKGHQLSAHLQYALREVARLREDNVLTPGTADSLPPAAAGIPYDVVPSTAPAIEVVSLTEALSNATDAPEAEDAPATPRTARLSRGEASARADFFTESSRQFEANLKSLKEQINNMAAQINGQDKIIEELKNNKEENKKHNLKIDIEELRK